MDSVEFISWFCSVTFCMMRPPQGKMMDSLCLFYSSVNRIDCDVKSC